MKIYLEKHSGDEEMVEVWGLKDGAPRYLYAVVHHDLFSGDTEIYKGLEETGSATVEVKAV